MTGIAERPPLAFANVPPATRQLAHFELQESIASATRASKRERKIRWEGQGKREGSRMGQQDDEERRMWRFGAGWGLESANPENSDRGVEGSQVGQELGTFWVAVVLLSLNFTIIDSIMFRMSQRVGFLFKFSKTNSFFVLNGVVCV